MINPELEAEIARAAPDDTAPYLVYADWLIEKGDPRGELIVAAVRGERDREQELHEAHDAAWLGELHGMEGVSKSWRNGFLFGITIGGTGNKRWGAVELDHREVYGKLRALPVASQLRHLTFDATADDDGMPDWWDAIHAIVEHGLPASLRGLEFDKGEYWDISSTELGELARIYPLAATLEQLRIRLGHMELGKIVLPALRDFEVTTGGFTKDNMQSVLDAEWPELERLILTFGDNEDYGAECQLADVLPLLDGSRIPNVRELGIANAPFLDDLIPELVRSPVLPRLTTLDLSLGTMSDAGADAIAKHADAFKHLAKLDLHRNFISDAACARVRELLPQADLAKQEAADEYDGEVYRYCKIGE